MNELEIKIKKFLEENNPGFKSMNYVKEYCRKYINRSLNIKSNGITTGRIKIKENNFKSDYRIKIRKYRDANEFYLFVGNLTTQGVSLNNLDIVIDFNENLARKLHFNEIVVDAMNGGGAQNEIKAYDQRGYKIIKGYFGTRVKKL